MQENDHWPVARWVKFLRQVQQITYPLASAGQIREGLMSSLQIGITERGQRGLCGSACGGQFDSRS